MLFTIYDLHWGERSRAFAAERIRTLAVGDDHFTPRPLPSEPFGNSLGVFTGEPERIEILFDARTSPLVLEREWHTSQKFICAGSQ